MRLESDSLNQQLQRSVRKDRLAPVLGNEKRVKRLAGGPWKRILCDHGVVRRMGLVSMLLRVEAGSGLPAGCLPFPGVASYPRHNSQGSF